MAKNGRKGAGRKGELKKRSQVFSGRNKRFTKVDDTRAFYGPKGRKVEVVSRGKKEVV